MSKTTNNNGSNNKNNDSSDSDSPLHYLMWFRRDLRIHDNTALAALCERANEDNASVSAIFFLTPEQWQQHDTSLVQVDHIARTLPILAKDLKSQLNITLMVQLCPSFSDCIESLTSLCKDNDISCVMANHEYEGNEIGRDEQLCEQLAKDDIEFVRWHDQCILPPLSITTNDGDSMYKVFTPFYKKWRHTLDVSTIQMHDAPAVDCDDKIELKSSKNSAHTADDIKALSEEMLGDYQKTLQKRTRYSISI
ncbi:hypothetical protein PKHYL_07480 [Psychrobacter sp. KH172YL61]|uniref:deoxyribodipyrimidine photo-lyase n=1 Tax=Psychrobacter sp. KH172YL61 TaxID=2517899 RepID=UPI0010BA6EF2|nr:deoxyribodipyrimidine photo-lyase [Psychrobacter sp. KH172YL61]BBI66557.1 hypothetical protein PKHYL_07480 [Psychrobacter sp. KH172YL61]